MLSGGGSFVNAGMRKEVKVDKLIKPDVRVTVKLDPYDDGECNMHIISSDFLSFSFVCSFGVVFLVNKRVNKN